MSDLTNFVLNDDEREEVKADPFKVACELAWATSSNIVWIIHKNNGIPNGRLIAIEIEKAFEQLRADLAEYYESRKQ